MIKKFFNSLLTNQRVFVKIVTSKKGKVYGKEVQRQVELPNVR